MHPPADRRDVAGWDQFWIEREKRNLFFDAIPMFSLVPAVVLYAQRHDLHTVLCVGNGIEQGPIAMAAAGLRVIAIDLSPVATRLAMRFSQKNPEHGVPEPIRRPGGSAEFITGDLFHQELFPGPFDIVMENRTIQLFEKADRDVALDRLLARLASNGLFVSSAHHGAWRPPAPYPKHPLGDLLRSRGIRVEGPPRPGSDLPPPGMQAWLSMSTG